MELRKIKLEEIVGAVYQPRVQEDPEIDELVESILKNGLIVPLLVVSVSQSLKVIERGKLGVRQRRLSGRGYALISGNRRVKALKIVEKRAERDKQFILPTGFASLTPERKIITQALVIERGGDFSTAITGLVDNLNRLDLSPLERAVCYKEMMKIYEMTQEELADKAGISKGEISKYIRYYDKLPKEIFESWNRGEISLKHVEIIMRLKSDEKKMELYKMIRESGLSVADAEFWCERLRDKETIRPEDRKFYLMEEKLVKEPVLKKYIKDKRIRMTKSKQGEWVAFDISSVDELKTILGLVLKLL